MVEVSPDYTLSNEGIIYHNGIRLQTSKQGTVCIKISGKHKSTQLKGLMEKHYLPGIPNGHVYTWKDNDKANNHIDNFIPRKKKDKLKFNRSKLRGNRRVLMSFLDIEEFHRLRNSGWSLAQLAEKFSIAINTASYYNKREVITIFNKKYLIVKRNDRSRASNIQPIQQQTLHQLLQKAC